MIKSDETLVFPAVAATHIGIVDDAVTFLQDGIDGEHDDVVEVPRKMLGILFSHLLRRLEPHEVSHLRDIAECICSKLTAEG